MPDISATLPVIVAGRPPKELSGFDADMSEPAERQRERLDRINDDDPQYKERQRNRSSAAESHNNGDSQASSETAQAEPLFGRRVEDRAGDSARQDFNDHRRGRADASLNHLLITTPGLPHAGFLAQFISQATDDGRGAERDLVEGRFADASDRYLATENLPASSRGLASLIEPV